MKIALLVSLTMILSSLSAQTEGKGILWDKTEVRFDTVNQGEKLRAIYTLYNKSDTVLYIENIMHSCGCMIGQIQKRSINKDDSTKIIVDFNTNNKSGKQHRMTTVYTDQGFFELSIYAYIRREDDKKK